MKTINECQKYEISNFGKIRNIKTQRIRKAKINNKGYEQIILFINSKPKSYYVHRLVASNYIKNPNHYKEINHINENKLDNRVCNLEYCDTKYNCNYGTRNQRIINAKRQTFKTIIQKDKNNNIIRIWNDIIEIQQETKYNKHNIYKCCENKYKYAYGYKWEYSTLL